MSENQAPKKRGRPVSREQFDLPQQMAENLEKIGFFRPEVDRFRIWPYLRHSDKSEAVFRFRATLERAVSINGRSAVESNLGKSWKQISRYLQGANVPSKVLKVLALIADVPETWLISGDPTSGFLSILQTVSNEVSVSCLSARERHHVLAGAKRIVSEFPDLKSKLWSPEAIENAITSQVRNEIANVFGDFGHQDGAAGGNKDKNGDLGADYVPIDRYPIQASAGHGSKVFDEPPAHVWPVPRDMLRHFTGLARNLASTDVRGDSMEPTLHDGDPIIFDRSARLVDREAVYVLTVGEDLFVKRLRRIPTQDGTTLSLISDNPAYPEVRLDPDTQERVRIHGRVVWPNTSRRV